MLNDTTKKKKLQSCIYITQGCIKVAGYISVDVLVLQSNNLNMDFNIVLRIYNFLL